MKAIMSIMMLLAVFAASFAGPVSAQNDTAENAAAENMTLTAPSEQVSRFTQLSRGAPSAVESLSKSIAAGYKDVTQTADTGSVFAREPGVPIPSVKVSITRVNVIGEKWVEITNQAVGSWDLTGWMLASAGNATYTFPQLVLNSTDAVKVHEGAGTDSKTDLYTAGPLWTVNVIELQDTAGRSISSYDVATAPTQAPKWVNPLDKNIQY